MGSKEMLQKIAFLMQCAEFVRLAGREDEYLERLYEIDEMKDEVIKRFPWMGNMTFDQMCESQGVYSYFFKRNWPVDYWPQVPKLSRHQI